MARKSKIKEINELLQPMWAVVDGVSCFGTNLTYNEALQVVDSVNNDSMVIVTQAVASRILTLST